MGRPCAALDLGGRRAILPSVWMVNGCVLDGGEMVMAAETEKITLNLGPIDLGQIDLLVQEGFYSNRTDFILRGNPQPSGQPKEIQQWTKR